MPCTSTAGQFVALNASQLGEVLGKRRTSFGNQFEGRSANEVPIYCEIL